MKKTLVLSFVAGICLLMANCSHKTTKPITSKKNADMEKVAEIKAKYTSAQLEEGKAIYESHCNKCHKLFDPQEFNVSKWEGVLPSMTKKAKLTDDQSALVRAYVLSHVKVG